MSLRVPKVSLPWKRLFAEFGVIVAGVLIALAVDSWWERRQEHKQAKEYLQQLLVDLKATQHNLQGTIDAETKMLERVNVVLGRASEGPLPPADSLDLPAGYNYFEAPTGTLTALVEGGDLRLIRNDSLRFVLIRYAALIEGNETVLRHTENLIWNSMERAVLGRVRHSRRGSRGAANGAVQIDVAGALNDPDVISALQMQAAASQMRLFNLQRLEKPGARIIEQLEAELGIRNRQSR